MIKVSDKLDQEIKELLHTPEYPNIKPSHKWHCKDDKELKQILEIMTLNDNFFICYIRIEYTRYVIYYKWLGGSVVEEL